MFHAINYYKHLLEYIVRQKSPCHVPSSIVHKKTVPAALIRRGNTIIKEKTVNAEMSEPPCRVSFYPNTTERAVV